MIEEKQTGTLRPLAQTAAGLAIHAAHESTPSTPLLHFIRGMRGTNLFLPNGSRLVPVSSVVEEKLRGLVENKDDARIEEELIALGLDIPPLIRDEPLQDPPTYALSLAIAQKCNMGCTYCYADQGGFGGAAKNMPIETAIKAIDLLLKDRSAGERAQLTFLGGEPLINRQDIRTAVGYAEKKAREKSVNIGFSVTTNGTLLTADDAAFFEDHGFSVTISLDGKKEDHDRLRPMKNGTGSYERVISKIQPLLKRQRKMQVSARVTVTPHNTNLPEVLDELIEMGFHSVGFSPLLNSGGGQDEMSKQSLKIFLQNMIECGLMFEKSIIEGKRYPFLNMINAFKEIAKRTHRPYPCGAGAGYLAVSADGDLAACHRFVNEPAGRMGDVLNGIDPQLQNGWLAERHVHKQSPCSTCWARYLCGGGCHHEVISKGRTACDYIRGWLHYCLQAYIRIHTCRPEFFGTNGSPNL